MARRLGVRGMIAASASPRTTPAALNLVAGNSRVLSRTERCTSREPQREQENRKGEGRGRHRLPFPVLSCDPRLPFLLLLPPTSPRVQRRRTFLFMRLRILYIFRGEGDRDRILLFLYFFFRLFWGRRQRESRTKIIAFHEKVAVSEPKLCFI